MQKLIWKNSLGVEVDLTSGIDGTGPYMITEWEGFSGVEQTIQSQQVPFNDGSVYIDGLLGNRTLTVTLAIQDNNNLTTRYQLRRELIAALNPKLKEGYLIYKNDYIEKQIKCVPEVPIFETHNSDTSGTPKASLSWVACNPYWEDVEETVVYMKAGSRSFIENNGDIPCGVKIDLFSNNVVNPEIKNFTQGKKIKLNGTFNNSVEINTNTGSKAVHGSEVSFNLNNLGSALDSIAYSEKLGLYVMGGASSSLGINFLISTDGVTWTPTDCGITDNIKKIIYIESQEKFVFITSNGKVGNSSDGLTWTVNTIASSIFTLDICYSEELDLFVVTCNNGRIITSSDLEIWDTVDTGLSAYFRSVVYSADKEMFIAVGDNGVIRKSYDGASWISASSGTSTRLWGVCYSKAMGLFIAVGESAKILSSPDGSTWTTRYYSGSADFKGVTYSEELGVFIAVGGAVISSTDGVNWAVRKTETDLNEVVYFKDLGLFYSVGKGSIFSSFDGYEWDEIMYCNNANDMINLIYCEPLKLYVGTCGAGYIAYSTDGKTFTYKTVSLGALYGICYSEKLGIFVACGMDSRYRVFTSPDGINWTPRATAGEHWYYSVVYSEELEKFVLVGGNTIQTSTDGITWTEQTSGELYGIRLNCVIYKNHMFMAVGSSGTILTSPDGVTWTSKTSGVTEELAGVVYSDSLKMYVVVGAYTIILTSVNGDIWNVQNSGGTSSLGSIAFSERLGMFLAVDEVGSVLTSTDGELWFTKDIGLGIRLNNCIYVNKDESFFIAGDKAVVLQSLFSETDNLISKLTADSDMTLGLEIGMNQLLLNKSSGGLNGKVTYRQRYVGV